MSLDLFRQACFAYPVLGGMLLDAKNLSEIQNLRLSRLYHYARLHTSFYRRHYLNLDPRDCNLESLPVVTKTMLMRDFKAFLSDTTLSRYEINQYLQTKHYSDDFRHGQYEVWQSSGSSGQPGIFVIDQNCMAIYDDLEIQRCSGLEAVYKCLNPLFLGERVAYLGVLNGHYAGVISFERWRRANPLTQSLMQVFSILEPIDEIVEALNQFQPTILATYPSFGVVLAKELSRHLDIQPKIIHFGGETLTPAERVFIEKSFHCVVRNSYGASEFLPMAWECDAQELHLNTDWLILEPIDREGRVIEDGSQSASCLLSNLANYAQPLIRYELGDQIQLIHEVCSCGCQLPRVRVLGRQDDVLYFNGQEDHLVGLSPMAMTTFLEEQLGLTQYQVIQKNQQHCCLRVADAQADDLYKQQVEQLLRTYLAQQKIKEVQVEVECAPLLQEKSGKIKRVLACQSHH